MMTQAETVEQGHKSDFENVGFPAAAIQTIKDRRPRQETPKGVHP